MSRSIRKKTELLSPAGSFDTLKAVAEAGADAVYAAGNKFGARAYAENFTEEELLKALDYLHLRGKCLYLTVNTLLKEQEIEELQEFLNPLYEAGLDGVIVQDMGVLRFIRNHFPLLPIHASTQMTITGAYGAKLLLEAGCSRIVAARELTLEEISHIYKTTGAEIESFVHGALCYCYSGQCLLSSMIGGRSGNRGRCAQPCRLPYQFSGSGKGCSGNRTEGYPLSLKDLCAIELLPRLIQSGVYSFKIEGRMKQTEYAAGVTRIYRKYLDKYGLNPGQAYQVEEEDKKTLLGLGNRCGFTDGYFTRKNGKEMIAFSNPSHEKRKTGLRGCRTEKGSFLGHKEKIKGTLRLFQENSSKLMLQYKDIQVEVTGEQVQAAVKQPLSEETVLEKMQKTGNTPFIFEEFKVEMDEDAFLTVGALNQLRRSGLDRLQEEILKGYRRTGGKNEKIPVKAAGNSGKAIMDGRELELRVLASTLGQFQAALKQPEVVRVYLESSAYSRMALARQLQVQVGQAHEVKKRCYLALPYIFRMETARWFCSHWQEIQQTNVDGYLVRNYEEIQFLKEMGISPDDIQGDYNLYGYSNEALKGLAELPLIYFTLPAELNFKELKGIDCRKGEMIIYGYQPVMASSQCLRKNIMNCDRKAGISNLKDRYGKMFPVKNQCEDCYNIIYNTSPLSLLHHMDAIRSLHLSGIRLSFTTEGPEEAEYVFSCCRQAASSAGSQEKYFSEYTNGHFKRGVE